jgi:hypothetical protein
VGVVNSKRQNSKKSPQAVSPKNAPKEALATLHRGFEQVLGDLERLEGLRIFPHRWQRKFLKTWRATLEETRSWVSFEVIEILHQREERDWVDFGRIRQRSETPSGSQVPAQKVTRSKPRSR